MCQVLVTGKCVHATAIGTCHFCSSLIFFISFCGTATTSNKIKLSYSVEIVFRHEVNILEQADKYVPSIGYWCMCTFHSGGHVSFLFFSHLFYFFLWHRNDIQQNKVIMLQHTTLLIRNGAIRHGNLISLKW